MLPRVSFLLRLLFPHSLKPTLMIEQCFRLAEESEYPQIIALPSLDKERQVCEIMHFVAVW